MVILNGLLEGTSKRQVISHDPSVMSMFNGLKGQEMHSLHLLYNKTIVDLCFGRHGVLLNSKLNHIDLPSETVNMMFTVHVHLNICQYTKTSMSTSTYVNTLKPLYIAPL